MLFNGQLALWWAVGGLVQGNDQTISQSSKAFCGLMSYASLFLTTVWIGLSYCGVDIIAIIAKPSDSGH